MLVGLGTTAIAISIGTVVGMLAGYYRGWVDRILNGLVELIWGFPLILIAVLLIGAIGPGLTGVVIAVGFVNWAGFARIVRGDVFALREKEFVAAARALGKNDIEIMVRHLLPNIVGSALVMGSYYIAIAIIAEAGLSFIGMGAQPPLPSLGQMGDLLRRGDLALAIGVDARVGRQGRAALAGSAAAHVGVDHCRYDAGNPLRA